MDTIEFTISEVVVKNLDGTVLSVDVAKVLANLIYTSVPDIGWVSHAMNIHAGKSIELTTEQARELINLIDSPRFMMIIAAKVALKEYINNLLNDKEYGTGDN